MVYDLTHVSVEAGDDSLGVHIDIVDEIVFRIISSLDDLVDPTHMLTTELV
jgi:hypothetical protein